MMEREGEGGMLGGGVMEEVTSITGQNLAAGVVAEEDHLAVVVAMLHTRGWITQDQTVVVETVVDLRKPLRSRKMWPLGFLLLRRPDQLLMHPGILN